ncbi:MAG: hypothetical protein HOO91_13905 [Bacteroidales bacterium]|nr:hypothetical protein [Bacteroidales bacterium]
MNKKQSGRIYSFVYILIALLYINSCSKVEKDKLPVLTTSIVSNIKQTTAICGGIISSDGGAQITSCGVCWSTSTNPTITCSKTSDSNENRKFISSIIGLVPGVTYYVRAYAINIVGTAYGNEISFSTNPTLFTLKASSVTKTSAICGGKITSNEGKTIISRGVCWSTFCNPTINDDHTIDGSGAGLFTSTLTMLKKSTTYYIRAYAVYVDTINYGNEISIATFSDAVVDMDIDADGNRYNEVIIGTQTWMSENLRTTRFLDGSSIPNVTDVSHWKNETEGAYCWFKNDITNRSVYGALYNIYTVLDNRKICPLGWRLPSDDDWVILENFLGGRDVAGGKLKDSSIWANPNTGGDNSSGFSALPGGYIIGPGMSGFARYSCWWSNTIVDAPDFCLWSRRLSFDEMSIEKEAVHVNTGFYVRCIKD